MPEARFTMQCLDMTTGKGRRLSQTVVTDGVTEEQGPVRIEFECPWGGGIIEAICTIVSNGQALRVNARCRDCRSTFYETVGST